MTNTVLPVVLTGEHEIYEYAESIRAEVERATCSWRKISEVLSEASNRFSTNSSKMNDLRSEIGFSKSKISKLVSIGNCQRLKKHWDKFATVDAWTVLYNITKLTDSEFDRLITLSEGDHVISQREVDFVKNKRADTKRTHKVLLHVEVDAEALACGGFEGSDYQALIESVAKACERSDFLRFVETDVIAKDYQALMNEIEREFDKVVRKEFNTAKKFYKTFTTDKTMFGLYTDEELRQLMRDKEYATVFDALESDEFDQERLYAKASRNAYEKREKKYRQLARQHNAFANNGIQNAA